MKNRVLSITIVFALVAGLLVSASPATAGPPPPDYKPVDVGPKLRELGPGEVQLFSGDFEGKSESSSSNETPYESYVVGDTIPGLWYFDHPVYGGLYTQDYIVAAIGENIEVWVATDLNFLPGDPRNPVVVTQEQIDYLVDQFDNNIFPTSQSFFGSSDVHNGTNAVLDDIFGYPEDVYKSEDGKDRVVAMISNIGDESFLDPGYPNYIAGFYWGTFEYYFDRNIISIDAYDWANRVGPDDSPWRGSNPLRWRPYLYEGVFAHEYQHLLHSDYDPDEVNFINEGLSMFAEYLTGYIVGNDAYSTFEALPENSLVAWGDQGGLEIVADYGTVFLYHMYLYEKFGQDFIQAEFHNPLNGISSINSTLAAFNKQTDFGEIYHDFSVAVLIDSKQANYRYGFEALDVAIDIGTADEPNPDAFDTPGAPPWGSDYVWIEGEGLAKFSFNGVNYTTFDTGWTSDGEVLYGGYGDLLDNWAIFPATGGGALTFDTYWDIEDYWDFGFVQVSTDGGHTWTSLANAYTTDLYDPSAHPTVIENLPGLTGWSGGWMNVSYDLSAYTGDVLLAFRYVTDWATPYDGWYVDNVHVDGELISDGSDASVFMDITEVVPINNNFTVSFVGIKEKKQGNQYKVHSMKLSDVTEEGLFELNKVLSWSDSAVMIVTFDAPEGFTGYADYTYVLTSTNAGPKK